MATHRQSVRLTPTMIHALRTLTITAAIVLTVDAVFAYWFLVFGPYPEDAFGIFD